MSTRALHKVLITGAGTGFGHEVALRLAEKGFDVVAGVEIHGQVQTLERQAAERDVTPARRPPSRTAPIHRQRRSRGARPEHLTNGAHA